MHVFHYTKKCNRNTQKLNVSMHCLNTDTRSWDDISCQSANSSMPHMRFKTSCLLSCAVERDLNKRYFLHAESAIAILDPKKVLP